jgi:hypothetical protein
MFNWFKLKAMSQLQPKRSNKDADISLTVTNLQQTANIYILPRIVNSSLSALMQINAYFCILRYHVSLEMHVTESIVHTNIRKTVSK